MTEPTINSHIVKMKTVHADVFVDATSPKFAAQAIKKAAEIGWKPLHILSGVSVSVGVVMRRAGIEAAQGTISSAYIKDPTDPQWKNDRGMKAWNEFLDKYYRDANRANGAVVYAYTVVRP